MRQVNNYFLIDQKLTERPIQKTSHQQILSNGVETVSRIFAVCAALLVVLDCYPAAAQCGTDWSGDRIVDAANEGGPCNLACGGGADAPCRKTCGCGTLLLWCGHPDCTGGPDLSEPLVTDRPDFTESSVTVGRRVLQVEMGYTFTEDAAAGTTTGSHSFPEVLFRYGILAEWLELRVGWNFGVETVAGQNDDGAEDLYLGFKVALTPQCEWLPEMALIPQMTVPTGADAFSADEVLPGLNWVYSWELTDRLSTAGSTQFNRAIDDGTDAVYTEWAQSWTVAASLTDELGIYAEWFAFFPHSADTVLPEHYFNGGFTYLLSNNVQWDIRAGVGLNDAADDYFVGTGLSVRFQ